MAETSTIEWTDSTWNPITGCTLVSEGCRHCYAAQLAATRLQNHPSRKGLARVNAAGEAKFTGEVRLNEQWLDQPLRWRRPRRIFVVAHGDLFHEGVPDEWIDRVFAVMALAPQHTFQVLTKRPERMRNYMLGLERDWERRLADRGAADFGDEAACFIANFINGWIAPRGTPFAGDPANGSRKRWPLPNVWLGTSVEDQATADVRIPDLLDAQAAVRFISAEPLLGPIDLNGLPCGVQRNMSALGPGYLFAEGPFVDWVIVGGESGKHARPMHPDWARALRDQCVAAGVPFFFKQWGEWLHEDQNWTSHFARSDPADAHTIKGFPEDGTWAVRVRKSQAGRVLDGRTWDETPGAPRDA